MNFNSTLQNTVKDSATLPEGLTAEDVAALSNYPSLSKLFETNDLIELETMQKKLGGSFQDVERIVLRGSNEDSGRAKSAAAALKIVIDFLEMVKQLKAGIARP